MVFAKGNIPWNKGVHMWRDRPNPRGMLGKKLSKEAREKISEYNRERWKNPAYRDKMTGRNPWNLGKHLSQETRKKISEAHKGKPSPKKGKKTGKPAWNTGKKWPQMSEMRKGKGNPMYGKHPSNEALRKKIKMWRLKPNKKEKLLIGLFEKHNLPFRYVGDGKLIIGGRCPDFSDGNGRLIELFGDYWHEPEEEQERVDFFKEHGYGCLVIWEHELKNEEAVASKVATFSA